MYYMKIVKSCEAYDKKQNKLIDTSKLLNQTGLVLDVIHSRHPNNSNIYLLSFGNVVLWIPEKDDNNIYLEYCI